MLIPADALLNGLERYRNDGIATGSFLRAVLENNLIDAVKRADETSLASLRSLVFTIDEHLPQAAYGSPAAVEAWLNMTPEQRLPHLRAYTRKPEAR